MLEVKGKYNTAKIFTDVVDQASIDQVKLLCDQEFVADSKIRMMPDIHAGAGCTIGTTMTFTDRIVPNLVGVDIGCGMEVVKLLEKDINLEKLDRVIRECIPSGFNVREKVHPYRCNCYIYNLYCFDNVNIGRAEKSIGTLGGGNHFIEVDKDDDGYLYLIVHSGSRHLGKEIAEYYQKMAEEILKVAYKASFDYDSKQIIDSLTTLGRKSEIKSELQKLKEQYIIPPKDLCWLRGDLMIEYIKDMNIAQEYAMWNRRAITDVIMDNLGLTPRERFTTIHNYIDTENMILRKGAVSARAGETLLIPINMRDGSLICVGKGNPDWNYSAPHGAGRLFGRTAAKNEFSVEEYREAMRGIYTTSVGLDTLDECPMAYKSMDDIIRNIGDTVDILKVIKPVYNFKAGN